MRDQKALNRLCRPLYPKIVGGVFESRNLEVKITHLTCARKNGLFGALIIVPLVMFYPHLSLANNWPEYDEKGRSKGEQEEESRQRDISNQAARSAIEKAEKNFIQFAQVQGDTSECAIYSKWKSNCVATVGKFNSSIQIDGKSVSPWFDTDSLRIMAMEARKGHYRQFVKREHESYLLEKVSDASRGLEKEKTLERMSAESDSRNIPASRLRALYQEHLTEIKMALDERKFEVIASTDSSLLMDSMAASPGGKTTASGVKHLGWKSDKIEAKKPNGIRPEIFDSILEPGWHGPIRTPFGYILIHKSGSIRPPDATYQDVLPILVRMSTQVDSKPDMARLVSSRFQEYQRHWSRFDTLELYVAISPRPIRKTKVQVSDSLKAALAGTSESAPQRVTWRRVPVDSLPDSVKTFIDRCRKPHGEEFFGGTSIPFGDWRFRFEVARPVQDRMKVPRAKESIISSILSEYRAKAVRAAMEEVNDKVKGKVISLYYSEEEESGIRTDSSLVNWESNWILPKSGLFE